MDIGLDFISLWAAGRVFAMGGNPYDTSSIFEVIEQNVDGVNNIPGGFHNPFYLLPFLAPFGLMPYRMASAVWFLGTWAIGIFSVHSILKNRTSDFKFIRNTPPVIINLLLLFFPFVKHLFVGQTTALSLLGLVLGANYMRKERYFSAGLAWSLLSVKPHLVFPLCIALGLWAVVHQRRALIKFSVGFFLPLLALSAFALILRPTLLFENMAGMAENYAWSISVRQVTLGFITAHAIGWQQAVPIFSAIGVILGFIFGAFPTTNLFKRCMHALFAGILFAPHGFSHDHVVILYPYLLTVDRILSWNKRAGAMIVAGLFLACAIPFSIDIFAFEWISIIVPMVLWISYSSISRGRAENAIENKN